jgi:hypothetical protein
MYKKGTKIARKTNKNRKEQKRNRKGVRYPNIYNLFRPYVATSDIPLAFNAGEAGDANPSEPFKNIGAFNAG